MGGKDHWPTGAASPLPMAHQTPAAPYQMSPTVKPSGNGSVGSTTYEVNA